MHGRQGHRIGMNPTLSRLWRSLSAAAFLSVTTLLAQAGDPREASIQTGSVTLLNVTKATIDGQINSGFRLTDLEYRSGSGIGTRFDAVLVENSGAYATAWWWLFDASAANVTNLINANQARLIDLESYTDSAGNRRFAAVTVDNTGVNGKAWWWLYDTNPANINQFVANNTARIVDLETYEVNGVTRYLAVMISNTGADARQWWWYTDVNFTQLNGYAAANNARVYDIERHIGGEFDCVMIQDPLPKPTWWWFGLTESQVLSMQQNHGARAFDIERYQSFFGTRYTVAAINNSNPLTTLVGETMRQATNGHVGCWMQEVNGANLAWLNGTTAFEPAEALAVLHHAHAVRRIHLGNSQPNSLVTVFQDYASGSLWCPVDTNPTVESLQTVLQKMMQYNDTRRMQAIVNYYGLSNVMTTAAPLLAMNTTDIDHRIGCTSDALLAPNQTSLRDLHRLHESVANGWLGNERDRFYDLMVDSSNALDAVVVAEGASLNLSPAELSCFDSYVRLAHKEGAYQLLLNSRKHSTDFGWIAVPFFSNGSVTMREYTFGAFVNDANSLGAANNAIHAAIREMLRPTIRSALQSWSQNVACTTVVGLGCGAPAFTQTASARPHLGTTVQYASQNGYPSALTAFAIGTSSSQANGVPLPVVLTAIGGEPGCQAYNDIVTADFAVSNGLGNTSFPFVVPPSTSIVGFEYFTQHYSFGAGSLRTSNGLRNVVGL